MLHEQWICHLKYPGDLISSPDFSFDSILPDQHRAEPNGQSYYAIYDLGPEEALSAFCYKRKRCVSVLRDTAGEEHWHRNDSGSVQSHEYHVGTGFRYDSDKSGQNYHQHGVVTYPFINGNVLKPDSYNQEYAECPSENSQEMFPYYMVPKVVFNKMIRCEQQNEQYEDAQSGEHHVHPVFAQQIESQP